MDYQLEKKRRDSSSSCYSVASCNLRYFWRGGERYQKRVLETSVKSDCLTFKGYWYSFEYLMFDSYDLGDISEEEEKLFNDTF